MPKFRIVINDESKAQTFEHGRHRRALQLAGAPAARLDALVNDKVGPARPVGTVHAELDSDCPYGRPNCRNCGDPAHAHTCRAAGHCPLCGTRHGIAPDSVLAANGFGLEPA